MRLIQKQVTKAGVLADIGKARLRGKLRQARLELKGRLTPAGRRRLHRAMALAQSIWSDHPAGYGVTGHALISRDEAEEMVREVCKQVDALSRQLDSIQRGELETVLRGSLRQDKADLLLAEKRAKAREAKARSRAKAKEATQ